MIEVSWGSLGLKDKYILWLKRKWVVTMLIVLTIAIGSFGLILGAFETQFSGPYAVCLTLWSVVMVILSVILSFINRRLHGIEKFLNIFEHRHEVRHQVFCTNHLHCLGLHYFKAF